MEERYKKGKKRELTIEEWEEIGVKVKEMDIRVLYELGEPLSSIPKGVWRYDYNTIIKGMSRLKDKLDERVFKEHPNQPSQRLCNVFYGEEGLMEKMRNEEDLSSHISKGEQRELWQDLKDAIVPILKKWDIPGSSIGRWDLYEALGREVAKMGLEFLRQKKK